MFQAILERILLKYFGSYLLDFNPKSLSLAIWNGKLRIQGLKLKPSIFSNLPLPLKLKYSWIGNLEIFVPWSHLSKLPVEIRISDIYLIMEPLDISLWGSKFNGLEGKIEKIEEIIREILNKEKKISEKKIGDKPGFFDMFVEKIIDNIQLKIENIHLRFENDAKDSLFALGLTLKQLVIETKDEKWEKRTFYDRTNPKNKKKPINKHLILSNLGIYMTTTGSEFLGHLELNEITNKMNIFEDIPKRKHSKLQDSLLDVSFELRLTNNFENNFYTLPEYLGELQVDLITLNLKSVQIQNLIRLLEFFNEFDNFLLNYKRSIHYLKSERPILLNIGNMSRRNKSQMVQNLWFYCGECVIFEIRKTNFVRCLNNLLNVNRKSLKFTKTNDPNLKILKSICSKTSTEYLTPWLVIFYSII